MKTNITARLEGVVARMPQHRFATPLNWVIEKSQHWAVIGPNGAGKSLLADTLQRKFALKEGDISYDDSQANPAGFVKSMAFRDIYTLADCKNCYYQQRWHATENDEVPTVDQLLQPHSLTDASVRLLQRFHIDEMLPKKLNYLSSGELRKFLIARTLLTAPRLLILDNPFIGLDTASRQLLAEMLEQVTQTGSVQVIMLLSDPKEIPPLITHVLPVIDRTCLPAMTRAQFLSDAALTGRLFPCLQWQANGKELPPLQLPVHPHKQPSHHRVTLRMEQVSIRYGERTILKGLDWEVLNGEKWALLGANGSGKSTLLSLVYADNPQSYANTLYLFDRKRGSGESIWDIKRRIGYVSPEMHLYFRQNVSALQVVGSGLFDAVGLFRSCNAEQEQTALAWMELFGMAHAKERMFLTLSSGEQRLLLLARAFVKDPDLIILDEPLHGLDIHNKQRAARIIEQFCARPGKTLIYVTHYPHELPACVNKRFVLKGPQHNP